MNGYVKILKIDAEKKDAEYLERSQSLGESVNCDSYFMPFLDDINELYCWVRVEAALTTLSFREQEKEEIRSFEDAINDGLIIKKNI